MYNYAYRVSIPGGRVSVYSVLHRGVRIEYMFTDHYASIQTYVKRVDRDQAFSRVLDIAPACWETLVDRCNFFPITRTYPAFEMALTERSKSARKKMNSKGTDP